MADEFEALRTIDEPAGDLTPDRAARMRARALASAFGDPIPADREESGTVLTEVPEDRRPADVRPGHARRPRRVEQADHIMRLVPDGPATEIHLDRPAGDRDGAARPSAVGGGRRRPFVVVAAAAAVIAIVVGLAVARSGQRSEVVADQPQTTTVAEIASNAATLVDRPLLAGEYAYLQTDRALPYTDIDGTQTTQARVHETWISSTGEGRDRRSAPEILDGSGRPTGTADVATDTGPTPVTVTGFGSFGYKRLRSFPTDAAGLRAALGSNTFAPDSTSARSYMIADLLMLDATPPAVRAAALTILAEDGATVIPDAVDHDGRAGIGIALQRDDGFTTVYVVNRDGLLLGSYDVVNGAPLDPDRAVAWSTMRDQRRVTTTA